MLTFILIFNTYSPTFATSPDPAAAIPVTAYEVYTYVTLVLTYLGVEFKNAQERQRWINEEALPSRMPTTDLPDGYYTVEDFVKYQIYKAKKSAKLGGSGQPPKPEPRQIAIPVPDSLIDNLYNKLKDLVQVGEPSVPTSLSEIFPNKLINNYVITNDERYIRYYISTDDNVLKYITYQENGKNMVKIKCLNENGQLVSGYTTVFKKLSNYIYPVERFAESSFMPLANFSVQSNFVGSDLSLITLPTGSFNLNWTSPYTGMQTVTIPLTTTGIESPVEVPVIPGEYVESAPDEVTNPIQKPDNDPLINPETGLPFIDPETGLPIFPSTPIVPVTPITPIPEPEELTQPKDYTPNLTEISNGIKQLPERIINPIKKLFIPDKVSKIDFSPLNVPITKKFPFSIPFDLANMFQNFSAGGEPPKWDINLVFMDYSETVTIDLARFEKWAEITRFFVFIAFNIGLILVTRNLIRG